MTLTVCVGSSGSGKTTFLNDVYRSHKCTYIRQYHNLRPYIKVNAIPHFDPTKLPYWDHYVNENKAESIRVGGTMAGEFTAGLSGGQRKLLLFELIYQRTLSKSDLLIVLDEPFAGVTDDFVPFIVERLNEMRKAHNILLVTNDHVDTLKKLSDNTITVSAIDRTTVQINEKEDHFVDRETALMAMSVGDDYAYASSNQDLKFFFDVEIKWNGALMGIVGFTVVTFVLFIATFWDSQPGSEALVLVASQIIAYFCIQPYLLSLPDWRVHMSEEAEALMHASKATNKSLKTMLSFVLCMSITLVEYGVLNLCIDTFDSFDYFVAMFFDSFSMTLPFILLGLYTTLPFQAVQILGSLPFLTMIFFSTTFSPGAGIEGLKALRYLFARFYFWCMVPGVMDDMEGCPDEDVNLLYLVLSGFIGLFLFMAALAALSIRKKLTKQKKMAKRLSMLDNTAFMTLQEELFGEKALRKFQHLESARLSSRSSKGSLHHMNTSDVTESVDVDEEEKKDSV